MKYNDPYYGDFHKTVELPDGRVYGDGRLIDIVEPSHTFKITESAIPGACITHIVTL